MLTNKELGEYLKQIRKSRDLSLRQVDYKSDVSFSHLSMIENGTRKPSPLTLKELAKIYNLDYIDLYEKAGYIDLAEAERFDNSTNKKKSNSSNSAVVFVYGSIPAGVPMECIEDIIDTEEIPVDMLRGGKQYFGLKVKGNSMEPDYLDGDTLILEKADDCESGDDCVVMVNGNDGTFKRVIKNENGIILQPLNSEYYPLVFSNEQIESLPVRVIGIVEEIRRKKRRK